VPIFAFLPTTPLHFSLFLFITLEGSFIIHTKPENHIQLINQGVEIGGNIKQFPFYFVLVVFLEFLDGGVIEGFYEVGEVERFLLLYEGLVGGVG